MIKHYCNGCHHILIDYNKKYCDSCKTKFDKSKSKRVSPSYNHLIKSSRWTRLSRRVRKEKPMCEICLKNKKLGKQDFVNPSEEVHHIKKVRDRPDLEFDRDNLMALCKKCHKKLTEQGL